MDGVIYRGDEPIQDAIEAVNTLKERGCKLMFSTNNSAKLAEEYRSLLLSMGVEPPLDEASIITSGDVTAMYLEGEIKKYPDLLFKDENKINLQIYNWLADSDNHVTR